MRNTLNQDLPAEIETLAIFTGKPRFSRLLHVGQPNIGDREKFLARVNDLLDRRWFTNNGPYVQEFEKKLAEYLGVKHCIAISNATVALEIATRALDLKGEVIVPSFTFIASAHSLLWQGITPVFCDVDPITHCLDIKSVEQRITSRTTGIMGVHIFGKPCAIDELQSLTESKGLKLLFDAAHALGCSYKGKMIGNFGDAEVFSFHATKFINSFEGGAVTTSSSEIADRIRAMRNFGFKLPDQTVSAGTNAKMSEISAAMGLTSLESVNSIIAKNKQNLEVYREELRGMPGVQLIEYDPTEKNNFQYVILEVDEKIAGISRDEIIEILHAEQVLARRYFDPGCHQMEPYVSKLPHERDHLPQTEVLCKKVMSLPSGTGVSDYDIRGVASIIRTCVVYGKQIRAHKPGPQK